MSKLKGARPDPRSRPHFHPTPHTHIKQIYMERPMASVCGSTRERERKPSTSPWHSPTNQASLVFSRGMKSTLSYQIPTDDETLLYCTWSSRRPSLLYTIVIHKTYRDKREEASKLFFASSIPLLYTFLLFSLLRNQQRSAANPIMVKTCVRNELRFKREHKVGGGNLLVLISSPIVIFLCVRYSLQ